MLRHVVVIVLLLATAGSATAQEQEAEYTPRQLVLLSWTAVQDSLVNLIQLSGESDQRGEKTQQFTIAWTVAQRTLGEVTAPWSDITEPQRQIVLTYWSVAEEIVNVIRYTGTLTVLQQQMLLAYWINMRIALEAVLIHNFGSEEAQKEIILAHQWTVRDNFMVVLQFDSTETFRRFVLSHLSRDRIVLATTIQTNGSGMSELQWRGMITRWNGLAQVMATAGS